MRSLRIACMSDGAELWRKDRASLDHAVARGTTVYIRRAQESVDVIPIDGIGAEHLAGARDANASWILSRNDSGISITARGDNSTQQLAGPETNPSGYFLGDDWLVYGGRAPPSLYAYELATGRRATLCDATGDTDCDKIRVVQIAAPYVFLLDNDRLQGFELVGLGQ